MKEELKTGQEKTENLNKEFAALTEEGLADVSGGNTQDMSGMVDSMMKIMKMLNIDVSREEVIDMIKCGGAVLRNFAKGKSGNSPLANMIPVF